MLSSDDVVLAIAKAYGNKVPGRTLIQKLGYFIGLATKSDLGYAPHYYGPYSPQVAATLEERVACGDLEETVQEYGGSFSGHDETRKSYFYTITKTGQRAIDIHREWDKDEFDKAVELANVVRELNVDYMQLSFAAKVHCISKQQKSEITINGVQQAAKQLGWRMSPEDIEQGISILTKLGFIDREAVAKTAVA